MRNLSNLGLVEMTEQEMREVNGGYSLWDAVIDFTNFIARCTGGIEYDPRSRKKSVICECDTLGCEYCPCCGL